MDILPRDISSLLGLDALSEGERQQMLAKISELIHSAVIARALMVMPKEKQDEFEKLLDGNPAPEAVAGFLQTNVPDLSTIVEEEVRRFKEESVNILGAVK